MQQEVSSTGCCLGPNYGYSVTGLGMPPQACGSVLLAAAKINVGACQLTPLLPQGITPPLGRCGCLGQDRVQ